jgi:CRP-like cAMP-binding protein
VNQDQIVAAIGGMSLFGDLRGPQLEAVADTLSEESFPPGRRIQRQGFAGTGFHVILDGEAVVLVDGDERARLGKGDFFGESSLLIDSPAIADVVAATPVHTLNLAGPQLRPFLLDYPAVMYRMLQMVSRRLDVANRRD